MASAEKSAYKPFLGRAKIQLGPVLILVANVLFWAVSASAQVPNSSGRIETIEVALNKSTVITLDRPISKIAMGNDNIADIVVMRGQQLYVLGKKLGTTNVLMWDTNGQLIKSVDISVQYDLNNLKQKLALLVPDERIEVYSSQGSIVLNGQISSLGNMNSALEIARSFVATAQEEQKSGSTPDKSGGKGGSIASEKKVENKVINLMTIGGSQQVMIKVTVAELSRRTAKKLGVKFYSVNNSGNWTTGAVNGGASFTDAVDSEGNRFPIPGFDMVPIVGPVVKELVTNDLGIDDKGLFASYLGDDFLFSMALEAAKDNGTAKILAEPTLTTLSGQHAKFLSGGEFPIPVPQGGANNAITIQFKEFGVGVNFLPIVLNSGAINLNLNISVTELIDGNSIILSDDNVSQSFFVPALSTRSTSTTVELGDGQTIGIAGLISENMRSVVTKFPGLGDIPILGALFRSQEFERGETELVIMVTPYLATPVNNQLATLPTDSFVEPSDWGFYLLGRSYGPAQRVTEGRESRSSTVSTDNYSAEMTSSLSGSYTGGVDGKFGHTVQ